MKDSSFYRDHLFANCNPRFRFGMFAFYNNRYALALIPLRPAFGVYPLSLRERGKRGFEGASPSPPRPQNFSPLPVYGVEAGFSNPEEVAAFNPLL